VSSLLYGILWMLVRSLAHLFFRFRVEGQEHVPKNGGVLLAANHASYLDIPILGCAVRRRLWHLGRRDLFFPRLRPLFQALGWIPISANRLDRKGFELAIDLIRQGKAVVIYPEGGRSLTGKLRAGKPGIGIVVAQTGCPVIPVHIGGTHDALPPGASWPRMRPLSVRFGEALYFDGKLRELPEKTFYREVSRRVMLKIAELGGVEPPRETKARGVSPADTTHEPPAPGSLSAESGHGS
jgi:1-acyl-sn-glycerol-3-phosphate acyltransferase